VRISVGSHPQSRQECRLRPLAAREDPVRSSKRIELNRGDVAWRVFDGEYVVIHHDTSAYYGLNETASTIWTLLEQRSCDQADLIEAVARRHSTQSDDVAASVGDFLDRLLEEGLLLSSGHGGRAGATSPATAAQAFVEAPARFEPPTLVKHGVLEELLLSAE
jgi:hypothetical protein